MAPHTQMERYKAQLRTECSKNKCKRIFCRKISNPDALREVAKILSPYKDAFICDNIQRLLESPEPILGHPFIDLFFYVDSLINPTTFSLFQKQKQFQGKNKKHAEHLPKPEASMQPPEPVPKLRKTSIKNAINGGVLVPTENIDHSYCPIYSVKRTFAEKYILMGITALFLLQFQRQPKLILALVGLRCFVLSAQWNQIDLYYLEIFEQLVKFLHQKVTNSIIELPLAVSEKCTSKKCILQLAFTQSDLNEMILTISRILNSSIFTDLRKSMKTKRLLEIFKHLYDINKKANVVNSDEFYLFEFSNRANLKNELKNYRSAEQSILDYPFILPMHIKAEIIKMENVDSMKSTLQDVFFRSLFEGVINPHLFLAVRRAKTYEESLRLLRGLNEGELRKQVKVKFIDEDGLDSGGLKREFFHILSHSISHDLRLFQVKNERIWFKPGGSLEDYQTIGKIFGMALYNDAVLTVPFPCILFKKILGVPLDLDDLAEIEPENYTSLCNLKNCTEDELKEIELYFTVDYSVGDEHHLEELIHNGRYRQVTSSNLDAFCQAYAHFHTTKLIEKEFGAFIKGFNTLIQGDLLLLLLPRELERIVIGIDEIDIELLKENTSYTGYTAQTPIIKMFWEIFENYNESDRKKLLQFITGNDRIPVSSSRSPKLVIAKNGNNTNRLPSSHTCVSTLLLPEYSTKQMLEDKLSKAIQMTAGFFLS